MNLKHIYIMFIIAIFLSNCGSFQEKKELSSNDIVGHFAVEYNNQAGDAIIEKYSNKFKEDGTPYKIDTQNWGIIFYADGTFEQEVGITRKGKWLFELHKSNYTTSDMELRYDDGDIGSVNSFIIHEKGNFNIGAYLNIIEPLQYGGTLMHNHEFVPLYK